MYTEVDRERIALCGRDYEGWLVDDNTKYLYSEPSMRQRTYHYT